MSTEPEVEATWDFDAGWDEAEAKPFRIRLLGEVWELPRDVPAEAILKMDRLLIRYAEIERSGEIPDDMVLDDSMTPEGVLRGMVPPAVMDAWLAKRGPDGQPLLGYRRLLDVSRRLVAYYRGSDPSKAGEPAPNRAARRATKPRRSSASGRR